jgi:hypothetical protein
MVVIMVFLFKFLQSPLSAARLRRVALPPAPPLGGRSAPPKPTPQGGAIARFVLTEMHITLGKPFVGCTTQNSKLRTQNLFTIHHSPFIIHHC